MTQFDFTVALTVHAETVMAGPTLHSAEAAIAAAKKAGFRVERLIGFDTATAKSKEYMSQPFLDGWKKLDFEFRDQGKTRNELARVASGRWLAFLDGDDLFSENWLAEAGKMLARAEAAGDKIIVHPEFNWVFDAGQFVFTKPAQTDDLFTHYYFYAANYYDALCAAPTAAWLEHPYADRAVASGFAYEDWQWSVETMSSGWVHVSAMDTIIFKRRRDASQTLDARANAVTIRMIPPLAIDVAPFLGQRRIA